MTTSSRPVPARLDGIGIALSILCLLHCLALPLVATGALAWAASEHVHVGLTLALAAVVLTVAVPGYRRHRRAAVPILLATGVALLVAAVLMGEGPGETVATVLGSVALVTGHVLNLRLRPASRYGTAR